MPNKASNSALPAVQTIQHGMPAIEGKVEGERENASRERGRDFVSLKQCPSLGVGERGPL